MYAKAPCTMIQRAMHIHPTVAEYLPTVLFQAGTLWLKQKKNRRERALQ